MIQKDIRLIVFITLSFIIPLFANAQSWDQMENDYNSFLKNKQNDLAVSKAREMNSWAMKSEGDTSIYLPISLKLIGSAFENSDSAIFYYNSALNVLEKQNRKYHLQSAKLHYNKSLRYSKEKNINLSMQESDEAISILDKFEKPEYPFCIWVLNNAGNICLDLKKYNESEFYFNKSLEITITIVGKEHVDYGSGLNNLGLLYYTSGDYKLAVSYYKQASDTYKKVLGQEHLKYAGSLARLGVIYTLMIDYKNAETCLKQASDVYKKSLGEEHLDYGLNLNRLGLLYFTMGDYKTAETNYIKASEIFKIALGKEHPYYAECIGNIGLIYGEIGDYKAAESYVKLALVIFKKAFGEEHPNYATSLNNLGVIYAETSNYKAAETYFKHALEIRKKVLGEEHTDCAGSYTGLGNLCAEIGAYKTAETYYNQALEIYKKSYGTGHPFFAENIANLGMVYKKMGDYKAAETLYKQALEIYKNTFGEENPQYAHILSNLGILYKKIDDYKAAETFYKQALNIRKKTIGEEHPYYANSISLLGNLYLKMSKYKAADTYYKEALYIRKKTIGEDHPYYVYSLCNLGDLNMIMTNYKAAEPYYKKALSIKIDNLYSNFLWLSIKEKQAYWQQENIFFENMNRFSASAVVSIPASSVFAYNASLVSNSLLLETSIELDKAITNSSDPLLMDQFNEMKQLKKLVSKMQSEGSDKKELMDRYSSLADSLDKILVNQLGEYAAAKRKFEVTWKDVKAGLTPNEAAIEFASYFDEKDSVQKYMALLVRSDYEYPKLVKIGSEPEVKEAIQMKDLSTLYSLVWQGIDSLLEGVDRVYYSPDGELNNLSFSGLYRLENESDSISYLIDRYELHQLTTTRYLADGTLLKQKPFESSAVLLGGIDYNQIPCVIALTKVEESSEDYLFQLNLDKEVQQNRSSSFSSKMPPLKGTEIEVETISSLLNQTGWKATTYTGQSAGENQIKYDLLQKSPGVLHIATHGFAFPEIVKKESDLIQINEESTYKASEDPMVRCGLMLSGSNISWSGEPKKMIQQTGDDGILTAAEVANMDLSKTKLVVLSACETGLGKIEGSEGTFGLKRAFKLAGVEQLIVSLWSVPDKETMELMTLFYNDLSLTKNPVISFQKAQSEMRHRYPYDFEKWAGFVLVR
jgi:tetratricopeptide (TPR) repeat protein